MLALALAAIVAAPAAVGQAPPPLDVPFVGQAPEECAGAALAMVMRYWGAPGVEAADFAAGLVPQRRGTPTERLARLAEARGFAAVAFRGDREAMETHLAHGRPLIALLTAGTNAYHYVVVVARGEGRVVFHDPVLGPARVLAEAEWLRRATPTRQWTLLVQPASPGAEQASTHAPDRTDVSPWLAEAGQAFRSEDWRAAGDLAAQAALRHPEDAEAWRLLATSRFLEDRPADALRAWNEIGEPALDLVRIDGLVRLPHRRVLEYLDLGRGGLLTPARLERSERRLRLLPTVSLSRLDLRPRTDGRADLEGAVLERAAWPGWRGMLLESSVRGLAEHALFADLAFVGPSGDLLGASGYWHPHRDRLSVSAASPRALGLPGIVRVGLLADDQTYALVGPSATAPYREHRRGASLALDNWWTSSLRARLETGVDAWRGRAKTLSLVSRIEQRLLRDRLALVARAAGYWSSERPFYAASIQAAARTGDGHEPLSLAAEVAYDATSSRAPLGLWPGAGTGAGRDRWLRGWPLLADGVVTGPAFGPRLLSARLESTRTLRTIGPTLLRLAAFGEAARPSGTSLPASPPRWYADAGLGLRLRLPGVHSEVRVDAAVPIGGKGVVVSAGFGPAWP